MIEWKTRRWIDVWSRRELKGLWRYLCGQPRCRVCMYQRARLSTNETCTSKLCLDIGLVGFHCLLVLEQRLISKGGVFGVRVTYSHPFWTPRAPTQAFDGEADAGPARATFTLFVAFPGHPTVKTYFATQSTRPANKKEIIIQLPR